MTSPKEMGLSRSERTPEKIFRDENRSSNLDELPYTERLVLENLMLKKRIESQEMTIDALRLQLISHGIPIQAPSVPQELKDEIPERSQRRQPNAGRPLSSCENDLSSLTRTQTDVQPLSVLKLSNGNRESQDIGESNRSSVYSELQEAPQGPLYSNRSSAYSVLEHAAVSNLRGGKSMSVSESEDTNEYSAPAVKVQPKTQEVRKIPDINVYDDNKNRSVEDTRGDTSPLLKEEGHLLTDMSSSNSPQLSYKSKIKLPKNVSSPLSSTFEGIHTDSSAVYQLEDSKNVTSADTRIPPTPSTPEISGSMDISGTNSAFKYNSKFIHKPTEIMKQTSDFGRQLAAERGNASTPKINTAVQLPSFKTESQFLSTNSSTHSFVHSPTQDEQISFLIEPKDIHTISLDVVSTLSVMSNAQARKTDDSLCTIAIKDKETSKEMWSIRKTYNQLVSFDQSIRPVFDYFGLPSIPEKSLFTSSSPSKVDSRKSILQGYFSSIFLMPHIPQSLLLVICRFLSTNLVNPLDDYRSGAKKEGFLIKRYKGLGTNWKIRWCQVDGPFLEIYEYPGGPCIEQIRLVGSQIGKQNADSVAEDKGYRHAFLVLETNQKKLTGSQPKHFFCAESDDERNRWINSLIEFVEAPDSLGISVLDQRIPMFSGKLDKREQEDKGFRSSTVTTLSAFDQNSTSETVDLKESKEIKRQRKKSLFPFMTKFNNLVESGISDDSSQAIDTSPTLKQSPQSPEADIQLYLNKMNLEEDINTDIFGKNIEVAYNYSNGVIFDRKIPSICSRCIEFLLKSGAMYEEGIFRLSGSASTIRQLKEQFNDAHDVDLFESAFKPDIHTVAGLLKAYLRETPAPILGGQQYEDLKHIVESRGKQTSRSALAVIFRDYLSNSNNIDDIHYNTCYVIFRFLSLIITNKGVNKMNLRNMCIVFVPTLKISLEVLEAFLVDFPCIFEGSLPFPDEERENLDLYIPNF